jgi:hypothetical protein
MTTLRPDPARLQLEPAPLRAHVVLAALLAFPLIAVLGIQLVPTLHAGHSPAWILHGTAPFLAVLWVVLDLLMRRHRLALADGMLEVRTSLYRRQLPVARLDLAHARVLSLQERTEFKPILKLNGYALPGFVSGHFLLRDRTRAFVATAGGDRVLWLPVSGEAGLLLQPRDPTALLATLRTMAGAGTRQ